MKPVALFRHAPIEGPGYFADFLAARAIPWQLIAVDAGDAVPDNITNFSGLVFMGGPMSVNDDLPWIAPVLTRIREAIAAGVPVLGHCLGGQLMAKALGGEVTANPVKEIGWAEVTRTDTPEARQWLGETSQFTAFHWHGETFSLPEGAVRILGSAHCRNQAFVLGPNLGMQCHVEMTPEMIAAWCEAGAEEIARAISPAVQSPTTMLAHAPEYLPDLHALADQLYSHWLTGLRN